jgi:hypothetical protein
MNEKTKFVLPERNPKTHAAHRKEVFLQIMLPLVIGCLLLAALVAGVIWSATGSNSEVRRWADISLMWLILPALGFALILLVLLSGITYLVSRLLGVLPGYARWVQDYFTLGMLKVIHVTNVIVKPVMKLQSWSVGARRARQVAVEPLTFRPKEEV